jgi:hypothetical protein
VPRESTDIAVRKTRVLVSNLPCRGWFIQWSASRIRF